MAQTHRDGAEVDVMALLPYLLALKAGEFYGEITIKFRKGAVVGHVHEDRDHLVTSLPAASPAQIAEALTGVTSASS